MRKIVFIAVLLIAALACLILPRVRSKMGPVGEPVVLTMWHVYGNQAKSPMNDMVALFNNTVGRDNGVSITVTSVSTSESIHGALIASANAEPGSGDFPDLFVCYPKTAVALGTDFLMDWNGHFSEEERALYVPAFMEEGRIDGKQIVFPIAKSSEVLFVERNMFDRFAAESGVTWEDLSTWEGLYKAMALYYRRTDEKTPDVPNDGKFFLMYDNVLNAAQIAAAQLGGAFWDGGSMNFGDPSVEKAWTDFAEAAANGWICMYDGFATTQIMTGEAVCGIESTASILYFKDTVTHPDNSTEPLDLVTLPMPVYENGAKTVIQRGVGLCAKKSGDAAKEAAAALFCKWITEAENNLSFVTKTGYMPVKADSYKKLTDNDFLASLNGRYRSLFDAVAVMRRDYVFYTPPLFDDYGDIEKEYLTEMRDALITAQNDKAASTSDAVRALYGKLKKRFGK